MNSSNTKTGKNRSRQSRGYKNSIIKNNRAESIRRHVHTSDCVAQIYKLDKKRSDHKALITHDKAFTNMRGEFVSRTEIIDTVDARKKNKSDKLYVWQYQGESLTSGKLSEDTTLHVTDFYTHLSTIVTVQELRTTFCSVDNRFPVNMKKSIESSGNLEDISITVSTAKDNCDIDIDGFTAFLNKQLCNYYESRFNITFTGISVTVPETEDSTFVDGSLVDIEQEQYYDPSCLSNFLQDLSFFNPSTDD